MNRVNFNLPSFNIQGDLMSHEVFGYYSNSGVNISVYVYKLNSAFKKAWIIQVFSEHHVFKDVLDKVELSADHDLYEVLRRANSMTLNCAEEKLTESLRVAL